MISSKVFRNLLQYRIKNISSLSTYSLQYQEYGDPTAVVQKVESEISENLQSNEVLIKWLACPINPADINMIQGKYAIKPKFPAVCGGEGVAEVIKVGSSVKELKIGSWVIPAPVGSGTWRTHSIHTEDYLIQIDSTLPLVSAATLTVNPCTAYRMLKDFEPLKEGCTVIQNGANSAVGQAVIQIAKYFKINTINVVRDRPDLETLRSYLSNLGATHVVTENELRSPVMQDIFNTIQRPSLGFNCVGGRSASEILRHITNKGTLVTYGGMSKQPLMISTANLIFNDVRLRGFWMSHWVETHSYKDRLPMIKEMAEIIKKGFLKPPLYREVKFNDFRDAISKSMQPYITEKQILVM